MNFLNAKHNLKIVVCGILLFINVLHAFSDDTDEIKHIFSLDTDFIVTAVKNVGYGVGINYEHKLTDFLSVKSGFGHMVCFSDIIVVTVGINLFFNYYPLSDGLDKLYIGVGNGCDFLMYPEDDNMPEDTAIFLMPILGWKWKAKSYLMIEPYVGWKFYIMETNNYKEANNYLNYDFQWGINLKFFLKNKWFTRNREKVALSYGSYGSLSSAD